MTTVSTWMRNRWTVPGVSGLLVLASFAAQRLVGASVGDALMIAAAVVLILVFLALGKTYLDDARARAMLARLGQPGTGQGAHEG